MEYTCKKVRMLKMMVPADFHLPRQSCVVVNGEVRTKISKDHVFSITFGFLLHQKTGHALLFSYNKGHIAWFICSHHLQGQAVHSTLAAHFIQIIILEEVVSEPPLPICYPWVWQLNLKDSILSSGHSDITEFSDDTHTLWGWMGWWEISDQI